jgi:hypothetical protein
VAKVDTPSPAAQTPQPAAAAAPPAAPAVPAPVELTLSAAGLQGIGAAATKEELAAVPHEYEVAQVMLSGGEGEEYPAFTLTRGGTLVANLTPENGKIHYVQLVSPAIRTDKGLAVGATYEELVAAGKASCELNDDGPEEQGPSGTSAMCEVDGVKIGYEFTIDKRKKKHLDKALAGARVTAIWWAQR